MTSPIPVPVVRILAAPHAGAGVVAFAMMFAAGAAGDFGFDHVVGRDGSQGGRS